MNTANTCSSVLIRLTLLYTFEAPSPLNPTFPAAQSANPGAPTSGPAGGTRSSAGTPWDASASNSSINRSCPVCSKSTTS
eukprot:179150-Pleurochrysis_carterae.AAC.1